MNTNKNPARDFCGSDERGNTKTGEIIRLNDPKFQSNEEWLAEYVTHSEKEPKKPAALPAQTDHTIFKFDSFRTARLKRQNTHVGRLIISFVSIKTGIIADCFFNVDINKQRGKGEHKTGARGQFYPKPKSNFRKFWMESVQQPPRRWARVNKEMHKLKNLLFTGEIKDAFRGSGESYIQLINPGCLGTEKAQQGHNQGTTSAQNYGTAIYPLCQDRCRLT